MKIVIFFTALIASFSALSHETDDYMSAFVDRELNKSYSKIKEIEIIKSCTVDSECEVVSVGNSPCGNPLPQISYSVKTDIVSKNLIKYYAQRIELLTEVSMMGMTAECPFEKQPVVNCVSNSCLSTKELK